VAQKRDTSRTSVTGGFPVFCFQKPVSGYF
jgi:hypothetical protein